MKMTIYKYSLFFLAAIGVVACQKNDIDHFDTATDYIYFDVPFQTDSYGEETE